MKKVLLFSSFALLLASCGSSSSKSATTSAKTTEPTQYGNTITEGELKTKLYTYASDEFEGRETGKAGQKKAVEYLKKHYVNLGIPSPLGKDDYFQEVPLEVMKTPKVDLSVNGNNYEYFDDFIALSGGNTTQIKAEDIVFIGYGVDDDAHNDYENINVKGKIVVAKSGEPKNSDGTYKITGTTKGSKWSNGRQALSPKRNAAKDNGAKAFFFVDDALFSRFAPFMKRSAENGGSSRLSLKEKGDDMYMFLISEKLGKAFVSDIDSANQAKLTKTKVSMDYKSASDDIQSENVIAFIKGSEKPNEYIIISAHLDHEGIKDGEIYNGADDDGSGTVSILEIAEAFKAAVDAGQTPKRSIVFLHVTGEEKGLLGSRYYTDMDPVFPLENTVANLNIDMIGRIDPKRESENRNYLYLIGSDKLSTELHNISEEVNKKYTNIEFDYTFNDDNDPNRFYYRSDHYNFAKNNIPVIFYFNGTHDDYHRPSDTVEKIQYDLLENRTKLVFYTAWELANRDQRIVVDKAEEK